VNFPLNKTVSISSFLATGELLPKIDLLLEQGNDLGQTAGLQKVLVIAAACNYFSQN
jgi:hypothetical protein